MTNKCIDFCIFRTLLLFAHFAISRSHDVQLKIDFIIIEIFDNDIYVTLFGMFYMTIHMI